MLNILYHQLKNKCAKESYPHLKYFFQAYFHQNWINLAPSYEDVVWDFKSKERSETVVQVIQDLEHIFSQKLSESELHYLVNKQLKCSVYTPGLNLTYQAWLEAVLAILAGETP